MEKQKETDNGLEAIDAKRGYLQEENRKKMKELAREHNLRIDTDAALDALDHLAHCVRTGENFADATVEMDGFLHLFNTNDLDEVAERLVEEFGIPEGQVVAMGRIDRMVHKGEDLIDHTKVPAEKQTGIQRLIKKLFGSRR